MARLPERAYTFLLIGGALVIAVFQNSNRHGDVPHILPVAIAGFILIVSWVSWAVRFKEICENYNSNKNYVEIIDIPHLIIWSTALQDFTNNTGQYKTIYYIVDYKTMYQWV